MDPTDIVASLLSMSAASTQSSVNIAVLKKQFEMQKSAIDILDPTPTRPAPAPGTGLLVDKTA